MRRREVIAGLAALLPLMSHGAAAQVLTSPILIAMLSTGSEADAKRLVVSFKRGLQELGYGEGRHYLLEERFAAGAHSRLPMLADELVRLKPGIIIASSLQAAMAFKDITSGIPIVSPALGDDAVGVGLIASDARPRSNVTGVLVQTGAMAGKQLDVIRELIPGATKMGLLVNPRNAGSKAQREGAKEAAAALSIELATVEAQAADDFNAAFAMLAQADVGAVLVLADPFFFFERRRIAAAAGSVRLPSMYMFREYVEAGGLMSYGVDLQENYRQVARYADKILRGARPADLPVELPSKFELVINLKTAKALGLTIPDSILTRADQVIE